MIFKKRRHPDPPQNVRLIRADGTTEPIECVYAGVRWDGLHHWVSVHPVDFRPWAGDQLTADLLPARTVVDLRVRQ